MKEYPRWGVVMGMTAAVLITLSVAFVGNGAYQGYDTYAANPVQRFFYGQIEKKF
jgi:hypothetical protein